MAARRSVAIFSAPSPSTGSSGLAAWGPAGCGGSREPSVSKKESDQYGRRLVRIKTDASLQFDNLYGDQYHTVFININS